VSSLPWLAWLLPAVPLAVGAGLAVAGRRVSVAAPWVGAAAGAVTLVLACAAAAVRPSASAPLFAGIRAGVRVDGMSAVLVVTVTAVTLAVLVFAIGDLGPGENLGRFFWLMLIFAGAMLVTVTATTLALLLMGWEVMGAASYALIGYWWREPRRVTAASVAFLTTRAADPGLYVAAGGGQRPRAGRPASRVTALAGRRHRRGGAGRAGQVGSAAVVVLAVAGDGGSEPGLGAAALGHHGRRRRVPAAAHPGAAGRVWVGGVGGRLDGCGHRAGARAGRGRPD
jgi:hypothetical protein